MPCRGCRSHRLAQRLLQIGDQVIGVLKPAGQPDHTVVDTATLWRNQVAAWRRSELTQAAYCREHGLCTLPFPTWKRRLEPPQQRRNSKSPTSASTASPSSVTPGAPSFIEVTVAEAGDGQPEAIERAEDEVDTMAPGANRKTTPEPTCTAGLRLELGDGLVLSDPGPWTPVPRQVDGDRIGEGATDQGRERRPGRGRGAGPGSPAAAQGGTGGCISGIGVALAHAQKSYRIPARTKRPGSA